MSQETIPYDFVCKVLGQLLLESRYQQELLAQEHNRRLGDLQQKLASEQQKRVEAERGLSNQRTPG